MAYKSILITGGAGFIGSAVALHLKTEYPRARVTALDNLKRRGSELNLARLRAGGVEFTHGDVRCPEDLRSGGIDLIIECSAEPSVLAGYGDNPRYMVASNLDGANNCFELARQTRADVIFISTSRVYPYTSLNAVPCKETETRFEWTRLKEGVGESFPLNGPKTLYGATKLSAEVLLEEYRAAYGINTIVNRCGVVAGPGQFGKTDQGVFTYWMMAHFFGTRLSYIGYEGSGKQVRDVLHVADLCELIALQARQMKRLSAGTFNVGGGRSGSLSLLEATGLCESITGRRLSIGRQRGARPGDVRIYYSDNSAVSKATGWKPRRSPGQTLRETYEWIRDNEAELKCLMGQGL